MSTANVIRRICPFVVVSMFACACGRSAREDFVPELGQLMLLQQARHTKLWFAGEAGNWALADYEAEELGEGFDDVIKYHPIRQEMPVAPKDAIPRMITEPLASLRDAIRQKDHALFAERYDALTTACNNCHRATNVGFNQMQRPETNPFPDQIFSAPEN
ncbi:MAG TPA: hypothetical protein VKB36_23370 [Vicinamibacterales bacterium]|nr:hypothetical protein [Vicinamibacterales bacterium]